MVWWWYGQFDWDPGQHFHHIGSWNWILLDFDSIHIDVNQVNRNAFNVTTVSRCQNVPDTDVMWQQSDVSCPSVRQFSGFQAADICPHTPGRKKKLGSLASLALIGLRMEPLKLRTIISFDFVGLDMATWLGYDYSSLSFPYPTWGPTWWFHNVWVAKAKQVIWFGRPEAWTARVCSLRSHRPANA